MKLAQAIQEKKFDVRLKDKHMAEGAISKSDMDSFLEQLPDESDNMTTAKALDEKRVEEVVPEETQSAPQNANSFTSNDPYNNSGSGSDSGDNSGNNMSF